MKTLWRRVALTALRAVRPWLKLNAEQSSAYQIVIDLLEGL